MMDLSIIIVSFYTRARLQKCLQSVFGNLAKHSFEVFVVDNASADGSVDMVRAEFPQVRLIENKENMGYARANNIAIRKILNYPVIASGAKQSRGTEIAASPLAKLGVPRNDSRVHYILLLNPDVEVAPDSFDKMIAYMDNDNTVGIASCKVLKPDGKLDLASRRSFPNFGNALFRLTGLSFLFPKSKLSSYNLTYLSENEMTEVDSVMGAFFLIRRQTIDKIGLLDEDYFMYGEDIDWCYRAKQAGYKVMYVPITSVVHYKGSSSRQAPGLALYEFHRAMEIFYNKHYRQQHNFFINFLVIAAIWTRYAFKAVQNLFRREKFVSK